MTTKWRSACKRADKAEAKIERVKNAVTKGAAFTHRHPAKAEALEQAKDAVLEALAPPPTERTE